MTATAAQCPLYPVDQFPLPQRFSNRGAINAGLSRTDQTGFPQQARPVGTSPTTIALSFQMTKATYELWYRWVVTFGMTRYCLLPCIDQHPLSGITPSYDFAIAKFNGQLRTREINPDLVRVECSVHVLPMDSTEGIPGGGAGGAGSSGADNAYPIPPCLALETAVLNNGAVWYTSESGGLVWDWPFPAGGFDAIRIGATDNLANWGTWVFTQETYTDTELYFGKYPVNSCEDGKLNLYMRMWDGNLTSGIQPPYFSRTGGSPITQTQGDAFAFIVGRPTVDSDVSASNAITSRLWRNTWAARRGDGVTREAGGFQGNLQLDQDGTTGDLVFRFTHPGKEYEYLVSPFNATRFFISPESNNKVSTLTFSPGTDHGWLPVTISIRAHVAEIKDNWSSNFGNTNNLSIISSSTITIGVGDEVQSVTEADLFVEGNSNGWLVPEFIDPVDYGESANNASYLFDSRLALGGIGTYEGGHQEFYDNWIINQASS